MSSKYKITTEFDFSSELTLSNQLNLHTSLANIKTSITFSTLNPRENNDMVGLLPSSDSGSSSNNEDTVMAQEYAAVEQALLSVDPKAINELKSFSAPPGAVKNIANACCLLFAMRPEYTNFKKLVSDRDYMKKILNYDRNNVSDYVIVKLKPIVDLPEFTYEYTKKISSVSAVLCQWVRFIYSYSIKVLTNSLFCINLQLIQLLILAQE